VAGGLKVSRRSARRGEWVTFYSPPYVTIIINYDIIYNRILFLSRYYMVVPRHLIGVKAVIGFYSSDKNHVPIFQKDKERKTEANMMFRL
jgi:hypothetical protein